VPREANQAPEGQSRKNLHAIHIREVNQGSTGTFATGGSGTLCDASSFRPAFARSTCRTAPANQRLSIRSLDWEGILPGHFEAMMKAARRRGDRFVKIGRVEKARFNVSLR
jgi:hypothetical protein